MILDVLQSLAADNVREFVNAFLSDRVRRCAVLLLLTVCCCAHSRN